MPGVAWLEGRWRVPMPWAEALRTFKAGDHVFTIGEKGVLYREVLPAFARKVVASGAALVVCFPSPDLEAAEVAMAPALPELETWRRSGLVEFRSADFIAEVFLDPTPQGLRAVREMLVRDYREGAGRGRSVWYAGGMCGHLLERGHLSQSLFGEMFVQNLHWQIPLTMLCPHYGRLDDTIREGLEETHDGGL